MPWVLVTDIVKELELPVLRLFVFSDNCANPMDGSRTTSTDNELKNPIPGFLEARSGTLSGFKLARCMANGEV
jgi:hypothetical protein